eukprot:3331215-Rhodomonas_salina.1
MSQLQLSPSAYDSSPPPAPRKHRRSRADDIRSGSAGDSDTDHLFVLPQQILVPRETINFDMLMRFGKKQFELSALQEFRQQKNII